MGDEQTEAKQIGYDRIRVWQCLYRHHKCSLSSRSDPKTIVWMAVALIRVTAGRSKQRGDSTTTCRLPVMSEWSSCASSDDDDCACGLRCA